MARKEKEPTQLDVIKEHGLQLPVWARAVAGMAIDRVDFSEFQLKFKDGETLESKYPLFYNSLSNQIAMHISVAKKNRLTK